MKDARKEKDTDFFFSGWVDDRDAFLESWLPPLAIDE